MEGLNLLWLSCLQKHETEIKKYETRHKFPQRKDHVRTRGRWPRASHRVRAQEKSTLLTPWSWNSRCYSSEKAHFCGRSHLVCHGNSCYGNSSKPNGPRDSCSLAVLVHSLVLLVSTIEPHILANHRFDFRLLDQNQKGWRWKSGIRSSQALQGQASGWTV